MKCPHCRKPTAARGRNCVHCGRVAAGASAANQRRQISCPRCEGAVDTLMLASLELERCRTCSGIWLDRGELRQFRSLADDSGVQEGIRDALIEMRKPHSATSRVYLQCPICSDVMERRAYEDVTGIVVDRCAAHGTWLDHDDALRLFELVASGEETRLKEVAERRRKQVINQRLRDLENRQASHAQRLASHERRISLLMFLEWLD